MNLYQLAFRNIAGNSFRSWVVALCALLVASFALATTLIVQGAENSLRLAIARLGADIVVVPAGTAAKVENALLMGAPTQAWMPYENLDRIAAVPGVQVASPQLFLSSLSNAPCCSVSDMFMVAFDPKTDFTITPWLERTIGRDLRLGEAVGGTYIFMPAGMTTVMLYGYNVTLKATMEPTGTGLDQSLFFTFETAEDIAASSRMMASTSAAADTSEAAATMNGTESGTATSSRVTVMTPLKIPPDSISAVMVRLAPGSDAHAVALDIMHAVPDVVPIESPNLFQTYRMQMASLLNSVLAVLGVTWVMSMVLIGLVFSMAANERRRELGVLRALGATRGVVFEALVTEAGLLALGGGAVGIGVTILAVYLFHQAIVVSMGVPFLFPSPGLLMAQVGGGLGLALISVTLAALLPAYRISHQEPAAAMRE
jgi:putative ABC transport system permease protein